MKAIRPLISKLDKEAIASKLENSVRTVEAVMNCDRNNDDIEKELLRVALMNHAHLSRVLAAIQNQNMLTVSLDDLITIKNSPQWVNDEYYQRYNDIFLRLCHYDYSEMEELWKDFKASYIDVIMHSYYCCDLICRLCGVDEKTAINFYNSNI